MDVTGDLKERLAHLKKLWAADGVHSLSDVVERLLEEAERRGDAPPRGPAHANVDARVPQEEEGAERKQLLYYNDLVKEPKALKYFTGLKHEAHLWLWEKLGEAVGENVCFFLLLAPAFLRVQGSVMIVWFVLTHALYS